MAHLTGNHPSIVALTGMQQRASTDTGDKAGVGLLGAAAPLLAAAAAGHRRHRGRPAPPHLASHLLSHQAVKESDQGTLQQCKNNNQQSYLH